MAKQFYGRKKELEALNKLLKKKSASLVVVTGRRRIGKSRLIQEFAKGHTFFHFSGLPPTDDTTAASQRNEFTGQLCDQIGFPKVSLDDWSDVFRLLAKQVKQGRVIILFDEISWMGSFDPDFLGKLKNAWDLYFKSNPELILVLAGSTSSWINKNILSSTGFMGRISYRLTVKELPLKDCNKFWIGVGKHFSPYDKLKFLAISGGVPRYLEEMNPSLPAEENIRSMCFTPEGPLVFEFNDIFTDLFADKKGKYRQIIEVLSHGPLEMKDICAKLGMTRSGFVSENLDELVKAGFLSRDYTWLVPTKKTSRLSHFRLSDNYLRFYIKYIAPRLHEIESGGYSFKSLASLAAWPTIMGYQFENLVLGNREFIQSSLKIRPEDIVCNNPFFQRKTGQFPGVQVDYLIQTKFNILYVCEVKFCRDPLGYEVIQEMKKKIENIIVPKSYTCLPVLIQVNGIKQEVEDANYFAQIINFGDVFEQDVN